MRLSLTRPEAKAVLRFSSTVSRGKIFPRQQLRRALGLLVRPAGNRLIDQQHLGLLPLKMPKAVGGPGRVVVGVDHRDARVVAVDHVTHAGRVALVLAAAVDVEVLVAHSGLELADAALGRNR